MYPALSSNMANWEIPELKWRVQEMGDFPLPPDGHWRVLDGRSTVPAIVKKRTNGISHGSSKVAEPGKGVRFIQGLQMPTQSADSDLYCQPILEMANLFAIHLRTCWRTEVPTMVEMCAW